MLSVSPPPISYFSGWTNFLWNLACISISLCVCMWIPQSLLANGSIKNVTAVTNTHATLEELLDASFSTFAMPYQGKACRYFFPELLVSYPFQKWKKKGLWTFHVNCFCTWCLRGIIVTHLMAHLRIVVCSLSEISVVFLTEWCFESLEMTSLYITRFCFKIR
jgi:hypothetical protein